MTDNKKRPRGFVRGLGIYALILTLIILIGLAVFYKYIQCYENARPSHTISYYYDDLGSESLLNDASGFLDTLDTTLRSREESFDILRGIVADTVALKDVTGSTDDELVYKLKAGNDIIGSLHLVPGDVDIFGFRSWEIDRAEYDFESLIRKDVLLVPENCSVVCGETVLSDSYITARSLPFEIFAGFCDDFDFLPCQTEYTSGRYIGELEFTVKDPSGNTVEPGVETVLASLACSDTDTARLKSFVEAYQKAYIFFLSGDGRDFAGLKMSQVREFTLRDSPLDSRILQAYEGGIGFASSVKDSLVSIDYHNMVDFGNGYYLCDYTYYVETYGQHHSVTVTTNNARLMLVDNGGVLLACAQVSY